MVSKKHKLIGTKINNCLITGVFKKSDRFYFNMQCGCGKSFTCRCDYRAQSCGCKTGQIISKKRSLPGEEGQIRLFYRIYRNNANKRSIGWNVSLEAFRKAIKRNCVYCGAKPSAREFQRLSKKRYTKELLCNGIDRVDVNKPYTTDNINTSCTICNIAKWNLSVEEFSAWIDRLVDFRSSQ